MKKSGVRSRFDWLIVATFLCALGLFSMRGFDGYMSRDVGLYGYAGQQVAEGGVPYVDVFERGGPLSQLLPGLGVILARTVGVDDVLGMRLLFLMFSALEVALVYVLSRHLLDSRFAGLVAASVMAGFDGFIYFAANGPRDKTAMVLLVVGALLALVHQRWLLVGLLTGLATLTWLPAMIAMMAAVVPAIVFGVDPGHRRQALASVSLGGLLPIAATVVVYLAIGELGAFLDGFVLVNATYGTNTPLLDHVQVHVARLLTLYGFSFWLLVGGVLAGLVLGIGRIARSNATLRPALAAFVGVQGLTLCMVAWTLWVDFDNFPDLFVLLPAAAVGLAALVANRDDSAVVAKVAGIGLIIGALSNAVVYSLEHSAVGLSEQQASVDAILDAVPGDDEVILSIEAPQPLVLASLRNPSRFQLFNSGAADYVDDTWPAGLAGYAGWIEETSPTIIAVGVQSQATWLTSTLDDYYTPIGSAPGWAWHVHNNLGPERIETITDATGPAPQENG